LSLVDIHCPCFFALHRAPQHLTLHSFPTRRSSDLNFQGCITMPIAQVMRPPVRKLMRRGEMFEKSLAGETTLAATLTLRVAISSAIMARTTAKGFPRRERTATGSQSA